MKSKHTKGVIKLSNRIRSHKTLSGDLWSDFAKVYVRTDGLKSKEGLANAQLMADAFNVTNETGLTPRELQQSHAELLRGLKIAMRASRWTDYSKGSEYDIAKTILEKATK